MGTLMDGLRSEASLVFPAPGSGHAPLAARIIPLNITGIIFSSFGHSHAAGPGHRLDTSPEHFR